MNSRLYIYQNDCYRFTMSKSYDAFMKFDTSRYEGEFIGVCGD